MKHTIRSWLCLLVLFVSTTYADGYPSNSLYQLPAVLTDTRGNQHALDRYRGQPILVTMFYGSCPAACPLLIDTLRATERALPEKERASLRILMISIDPQRDTPAALATLAESRRIDTSRWELASTDAATVRKLAAALNIQYRQLPDGGYNHTSVITLLDAQGAMTYRSTLLGSADPQLVSAVRELIDR
jgi:protein SCO1